jgi:hypothetical protein
MFAFFMARDGKGWESQADIPESLLCAFSHWRAALASCQ